MAWLELTDKSNNKKVYVNAELIFRAEDWNGFSRLLIAATSGNNGTFSPETLYVTEEIDVVMSLIKSAGQRVISLNRA